MVLRALLMAFCCMRTFCTALVLPHARCTNALLPCNTHIPYRAHTYPYAHLLVPCLRITCIFAAPVVRLCTACLYAPLPPLYAICPLRTARLLHIPAFARARTRAHAPRCALRARTRGTDRIDWMIDVGGFILPTHTHTHHHLDRHLSFSGVSRSVGWKDRK